jgi:hypothetical protein
VAEARLSIRASPVRRWDHALGLTGIARISRIHRLDRNALWDEYMFLLAFAILAQASSAQSVDTTLLGAKPTECWKGLSSDTPEFAGCYTTTDGPALRVALKTNESTGIMSWRYIVTRLGDDTETSSGNFLKGGAPQTWNEVVPVPITEGLRPLYELRLFVEIGTAYVTRVMYVESVGQTTARHTWRLADTKIVLHPVGCWKRETAPLMNLVLTACSRKSSAIKAVLVSPARGLTLKQYVTNSIDLYSRTGIWHVKRRTTAPSNLGSGELLELTQFTGKTNQSIVKLFLEQDDKIAIVSIYNSDESTDVSDWVGIAP